MKITFLGHASFRIEIADQTLLIDPWLTGNPVLPEDQHQADVAGATHILLTHAHFDHMADVVRLSKELNVPLVGQYDLMGWLEEGEELAIGAHKFAVYHCPGHAPGHVVFYNEQAGFAHVGDVLFAGSIGRTDLPGGDHDTLINSIKTKLMAWPDSVQFICGHGPASSIGRERSSNPFLT